MNRGKFKFRILDSESIYEAQLNSMGDDYLLSLNGEYKMTISTKLVEAQIFCGLWTIVGDE